MRRVVCITLLIYLCFSSTMTFGQSLGWISQEPTGSLGSKKKDNADHLAVNEAFGNLTLRYELELPRGRGGNQPQLALHYNSSAANGPLGVGWSLSQLYIARREEAGGVDYQGKDFTFHMGESKTDLVCIGDTGEWVGAEEYRLKVDRGNCLRFFYFDSSAPYWLMHDKDGGTYYFWDHVFQAIDGPGDKSNILEWHISESTTPDGADTEYSYGMFDPAVGGRIYLTQINYFPCQVRLQYSARNDDPIEYVHGVNYTCSYKLDTIICEVLDSNGTTYVQAGRYDLDYDGHEYQGQFYDYSPATKRLLLNRITRVGADGTAMPPSVYEYNFFDMEDSLPYSAIELSGYSMEDLFRTIVGDFNGDGRMDVFAIRDDHQARVMLGTSEGNFEIQDWWLPWPSYSLTGGQSYGYNKFMFIPGDFNGDGLCDLVHVLNNDKIHVWLARLDAEGNFDNFDVGGQFPDEVGWASGEYQLPNHYIPSEGEYRRYVIRVGDFNRDGLDDLWIPKHGINNPGEFWIHFSDGDGTFTRESFALQHQFALPTTWEERQRYYGSVVDLNSDGWADLWHMDSQSTACAFYNRGINPATGSIDFEYVELPGTYEQMYNTTQAERRFAVSLADFNGDQQVDFVDFHSETAFEQYCGFNTGYVHNYDLSFRTHWTNGGYFTEDYHIKHKQSLNVGPYGCTTRIADFNGDGMSDILIMELGHCPGDPPYGEGKILLSDGNGSFATVGNLLSTVGNLGSVPVICADFTGDGMPDLCSFTESLMFKSTGGHRDLISGIRRGSATNCRVYWDDSAEHENNGMGISIPVVSRVEGQYDDFPTTTYEYSGGKVDRSKDLFLGFETTVTTLPNQSRTISQFHQDHDGEVDRVGLKHRETHYDAAGNTLSVTSWDWQTTGEEYPRFLHLAGVQKQVWGSPGNHSPIGTEVDFTYDPVHFGLLSETTSGFGAETITKTYTYVDTAPTHTLWCWKLASETVAGDQTGVALDRRWQYYPASSRLQREEAGGTGEVVEWVEYDYDTYGNVTQVTKPDGEQLLIEYDPVNGTHPTRKSAPGTGIEENYQYDLRFGVLNKFWDANGNLTELELDGFGRATDVRKYLGDEAVPAQMGFRQETTYYDGDQTSSIVERSYSSATEYKETIYYYDILGREIQMTTRAHDGRAIHVRSNWDAMGRASETRGPFFSSQWGARTDPDPGTDCPLVQYHYDGMGRRTSTTTQTSDGAATTTYDLLYFPQVTLTDADSTKKTLLKNHLGWTLEVEEYDDQQSPLVTSYEYDATGRVRKITDAGGNIVHIGYDERGRLVSRSHPDSGARLYHYGARGLLDSESDARGVDISYVYDELGRVEAQTYSGNNPPACSYTYDGATVLNGNMKQHVIDNGNETTTFLEYDINGNATHVSTNLDGSSEREMHYQYDWAGRISSVVYPDGFEVSYTYYPGTDMVSRVESSDGAILVEYRDYTPAEQCETTDYGTGLVAKYDYNDLDGRLDHLVVGPAVSGAPSADVHNRGFEYTLTGDPRYIHDYRRGAQLGRPNNEYVYEYSYDNRRQLTAEIEDGKTRGLLRFTYGNTGNILSKSIAGIAYSYQYGGSHPNAPATITQGSNSYSFEYDANGNMTRHHQIYNAAFPVDRALSYDGENRVSSTSFTAMGLTTTVDFRYSADGRRVAKYINGTNSGFYYNKYHEIRFGDPVDYIHVGTHRLAKRSGGNIQYYHYDYNGSVVAITDQAGEVVAEIAYDAAGRKKTISTADDPDYQYTGQEWDDEIKLYNYGARFYDAAISIFISPDPDDEQMFLPAALNKYAYCYNRPTKYVDPTGEVVFLAPAVIGYLTAVATSPDLGTDLQMISLDIARQDWAGLTGDIVGAAIPGVPGFGRALANGADWVSNAVDPAVRSGGEYAMKFLGRVYHAARSSASHLMLGKHQVTVNRAAGKVGEAFINKLYGGGRVSIRTASGNMRHIDNFVNGVAQEVKVGAFKLEGRVLEEALKDAELMRTPGSGVRRVEWHCLPGKDGRVGPGNAESLDALDKLDIDVIIWDLVDDSW